MSASTDTPPGLGNDESQTGPTTSTDVIASSMSGSSTTSTTNLSTTSLGSPFPMNHYGLSLPTSVSGNPGPSSGFPSNLGPLPISSPPSLSFLSSDGIPITSNIHAPSTFSLATSLSSNAFPSASIPFSSTGFPGLTSLPSLPSASLSHTLMGPSVTLPTSSLTSVLTGGPTASTGLGLLSSGPLPLSSLPPFQPSFLSPTLVTPTVTSIKDMFTTSQDGSSSTGGDVRIIEVWAHNLVEEMNKIVSLVDDYTYIAMDTEFPGTVSRPSDTNLSPAEYHYKMMKLNVDFLKVIQVGLFFCDERGQCLPNSCCWQFNFTFREFSDVCAPDSIRLLKASGINFKDHEQKGIDVHDFGELLMTSGVVLNDKIKWITFHAGYDYGYLLKILTCAPLPETEDKFFELLYIYFPNIYDIKYMMRSCENLRGGLQKVAESLGVVRVGPQHQAGSDAMLTAATYFKMREDYFEEAVDDRKYLGIIFGLRASGNTPKLLRHTTMTMGSNANSMAYGSGGNSNNSDRLGRNLYPHK